MIFLHGICGKRGEIIAQIPQCELLTIHWFPEVVRLLALRHFTVLCSNPSPPLVG